MDIQRIKKLFRGAGLYVRQRYLPLPSTAPRRLHLGCGPNRAEGWLNVDISFSWATDFLDDIRTLKRIPDGWADSIYACHVLEHFDFKEAPLVLQRWGRALKPGGELRISVPDLDRITRIYQKNLAHFQVPGHLPWTGLIYGGQLDQYDYHKNGFNFRSLSDLLAGLGFVDIQEYPHEPHFIPGMVDASLAHEPFGDFISLNLRAVKKGA
jgi:hypothetical protein